MSVKDSIQKAAKNEAECREERRQKAGHYRSEGTIIEPSGSRAVACEVSTILQGPAVPLSVVTYRSSYGIYRFSQKPN